MASFHSISFPSEWGVVKGSVNVNITYDESFHSISFPSEWGVSHKLTKVKRYLRVSIQLVSPASGERLIEIRKATPKPSKGFHSISFPSEWGACIDSVALSK